MKFDKVVSANGEVISADHGSLRVRYSRQGDDGLKNTLLTFKGEQGNIYFGISRCNLAAEDRFNRKRGKAIAASRLKKAINTFAKFNELVMTSDNFLYGTWPASDVKELVQYFKNIDHKINLYRKAEYNDRAIRKEEKAA